MVRVLLLVVACAVAAGCLAGPSDPPSAEPPASSLQWWPSGHGAGEPTLAVTSSGALFMGGSRLDALDGDSHLGTVLRSRDGGRTWEEVTPRLPDGTEAPPFNVDPIVYVDPATDRLFYLVMFPQDVCGYLSWSDDEGGSWSSGPVACASPPIYDHPTIVASAPRVLTTAGYASLVHICVNRVSDVWCARSLDGGLTWVSGQPAFLGVDPLAERSIFPEVPGVCGALTGHLAAAADGTLYLPKEHCLLPFLAVSRDDGTTWTLVTVSDIGTVHGPDPSVAVDADGNVHYLFAGIDGRLYLASSRDLGATWTEARVVSAPGINAVQHPTLAASASFPGVVVAYIGTDGIPGGWEAEEFSRPARERADDGPFRTARWHAYVARVRDPFAAALEVETFAATPPGDPLILGHCDPDECAGSLTHYNDVLVAPDGGVRAAYVDTCRDKCATPEGTWEDNDTQDGSGIGEGVIAAWWPEA